MCVDPITAIAVGGMAVSAVGSVMGTRTQVQGIRAQTDAQEAAYRKQAAEYKAQAEMSDRQAVLDQTSSQYQQRRKIEQNDVLASAQRNAMAGQGLGIDTGSGADIQIDSAREAALDIAAIQWGAKIKSQNQNFETAQGFSNANSALDAARTTRKTGKISERAAVWGGVSQLAGTAMQGASFFKGASNAQNTTNLGMKF